MAGTKIARIRQLKIEIEALQEAEAKVVPAPAAPDKELILMHLRGLRLQREAKLFILENFNIQP